MRIIGFQDTVENPVLNNVETKGFVDEKYLSSYRNNYTTITISKGFEYRPDLIAEYYLGNREDAWLITYINNFENGIKDYTFGRKIKIPVLS